MQRGGALWRELVEKARNAWGEATPHSRSALDEGAGDLVLVEEPRNAHKTEPRLPEPILCERAASQILWYSFIPAID